MYDIGKYLVLAGGVIILAGLVIWGMENKFAWFGHLPGDIRIERDTFRMYIPITSMLIVTIVLNLVIWVIRKFFF